ncbi:MAG: fructosamine kinase family protein [Myxococcota bacterium]
MNWPQAAVLEKLGERFGRVELRRMTSVGGGDINLAARLDTTAGTFFVKWNERPLPRLFSAEAEGLAALAAARSSLTVPEVIGWADPTPEAPGFLVMPFLTEGPQSANFDEALGQGLAEVHAHTADRFGFDEDNYIGTTPQPNARTERWIPFYRAHRLQHQVRLARNHGRISMADAQACDRLMQHLDHWLVEGPAALLHGDLWAGNVHGDGGHPALIDPAAYYGHPEAELGMMTLFGGFRPKTYHAYAEASGLDPDWQQRQPLYQLYHLLNHANLFGGGYAAQSMAIVRRFAGD